MPSVLPRYLSSLPLHAITEVYGEPGLRERFSLDTADFAPADRADLERALALAERLHRADRRVREPYLNHLLRVAIRIICYYHVRDTEVVIAALLHDAVEDHPTELAGGAPVDAIETAFGVLERDFGQRVAALVRSVTNPTYDPDRDINQQYLDHVAASLARDPWARAIKTSDFTDNGVGIIHTTGGKVRRSATKYRPLVPILRHAITLPDTPLDADVKRHILDQLDLAEQRFAAILDA